jgi:hypothetical protein
LENRSNGKCNRGGRCLLFQAPTFDFRDEIKRRKEKTHTDREERTQREETDRRDTEQREERSKTQIKEDPSSRSREEITGPLRDTTSEGHNTL